MMIPGIREDIHLIRGVYIMLDRDLAGLYGIETRALKQAVNRNKRRFPADFMFILTDEEIDLLVSQSVIPSRRHLGGSLPYAFTEQGVANLSSVLTCDKAIEVNIQIMRAFVAMRKFISRNAKIFDRIDSVERKHLEFKMKTDKNFEKVFDAIEDKDFVKRQGIFYDGQIFDAHRFISEIIRSAKNSIILIDNYIDDSVLTLFSKRRIGVSVTIYTRKISRQLRLDLKRYNSQYPPVVMNEFCDAHDRFMIIDDESVYHFGASLKDLGNKWFAFSRFDRKAIEILDRLK